MTPVQRTRRDRQRRAYAASAYSRRSPFSSSTPLTQRRVAVVKHAAGVVRRDHVMAAGSNATLRRVDLLVAELLADEPDLAAVLDVDQSVLTHDPVIPERVGAQKMRGREERPVLADDAKAVRDRLTGHLEPCSVV